MGLPEKLLVAMALAAANQERIMSRISSMLHSNDRHPASIGPLCMPFTLIISEVPYVL
jgi:hypothetical protein